MIFILLGILLLTLKLGSVQPVADWDWLSIALPFLLAICWLELFEPWLGLDIKRQQARKRELDRRIRLYRNKKPQRYRRG